MIVRKLTELPTDSIIKSDGWTSRRFLLRRDGMGFSMHDTLIHEGAELEMHYANHLEAVYCVKGRGHLIAKKSGKRFEIEAGTLYALDEHDEHTLCAHTLMRMICVFNPPLIGTEVHDENGIYPLLQENAPKSE